MRIVLLLLAALSAGTSPADGVVTQFYRHITSAKPLGIPTGDVKAAIWPLMTLRLRKQLDTAAACERDYFRTHTNPDAKPEFGWLEHGLFSGGNERALPAEVEIVKTVPDGPAKFRVSLRFTYRETLETYGRPPDPKNTLSWLGTAVVACRSGVCLIDDFIETEESGKPGRPLSQNFRGCSGARWVGYR